MKKSTLITLAFLAVAALSASYLLLPSISLDTFENQDKSVKKPDASANIKHTIGDVVGAITFVKTTGAEVREGDTLAYSITDKYLKQREALIAMSKNFSNDVKTLQLPSGFQTLLEEIIKTEMKTSQVSTQKSTSISKEEEELIEAELMGLEDAATDNLERLTQLLDAGKNDDPTYIELKQNLEAQQVKISLLRTRLGDASTEIEKLEKTYLSDEGKQALIDLSRALPFDTLFIESSHAGIWNQSSIQGELGFYSIIETNTEGDGDTENDSASYGLQAQGLPLLWAKAKRMSIDSIGEKKQRLVVRIE